MRTAHRVAATIATAILAGTLATPASAQSFPDDNSALDQYVASLPEPGGKRAPGQDERGRGGPLAEAVERRLASSGDGDVLREVATSPDLGAPSAADELAPRALPLRPARLALVTDEDRPGMLSALAGSAIGILALLLVLVTGIAATLFARSSEG